MPRGTKRFSIAKTIREGETEPDVTRVQQYLARYGYMNGPAFHPGTLDVTTQAALRTFQRRLGLPETGHVDDPTRAALEQPRCGTPDLTPVGGPAAAFGLRGCSYFAKFRTLTYSVNVGTPDVSLADARAAIREAFGTWQTEIGVDFVEVSPANRPNFQLGWFSGDHGDGSPFDGVGNTLAHAFYPPTCGGVHAGLCHFDDAELWATTGAIGRFDLETVALHEIGHLLGLEHSTVPGAVMFPTYAGLRRTLHNDDSAGIRALYGRRGIPLDVRVHLENVADLTFRDGEFAGTRGESRRLEGFQIAFSPPVAGLGFRYMAHLQDIGDVAFVVDGQFVGTRGQSRRLEGFAIELTGPNAGQFDVEYMAHLQDLGDTTLFRNGEFCGTRGQSRRVEGMLVRVTPK